jgi:very-long-chain (3R)-3-hydroxyacyl-CoA dehydratase
VPYPLLWLRYSAFILLYPFGVGSELSMAYLAMPSIKANKNWSIFMPNKWNFAFDYYIGCWVAIACYLPGMSPCLARVYDVHFCVFESVGGGA